MPPPHKGELVNWPFGPTGRQCRLEAGLFTIAVVYGAGGRALEGRGLNAQSPSRPDSRRLAPNGGGVEGAVWHGSEPKLTGRLEDLRNLVAGAVGVGDGRCGGWVLASQATPTTALQAWVKVWVPGEGRV